MSVTQIQQQQAVAKQAYEAGQITKEEYTKFMAYSEGQKQKAIAATVKTNVGTPVRQGYEVVSAKTYVPAPIPPEFGSPARAVYTPINPPATVTEFTLRKKAETVVIGSGGLLGVQTFLPEEEARKQGYNVDAAKYVAVYNPEEKAIRGLGAATIMATGVTAPAAGLASLIGTSAAEGIKLSVTGEHLTIDEALAVAGGSQAAYFAAKLLAPVARSSFDKLMNRLSPERAMYNRVVVEESVSKTTPVGTKSWSQRLTERISPEKAMYNRVVESAKTPKVTNTGPVTGLSEKLSGTGGTVKPTTSQWVQQQVLLQKPQVKLEIKPFTAPQQTTTAKILTTSAALLTSPKTTTLTKKITATAAKTQKVQKTVVESSTAPVQNPFTSYKGKPFYRQRQREESEIVAINYPANSPLQQPETIVAPKVTQLTRSQQGQKTAQQLQNKLIQVEKQVPRVGQREAQLESQLQRESQSGQQAQRIAQALQGGLRQQSPNKPRYPGLPRLGGSGGGARGSGGFGVGRWYKKRNPVATINQNLQGVAGIKPFRVKPKSRKSRKKKHKPRKKR